MLLRLAIRIRDRQLSFSAGAATWFVAFSNVTLWPFAFLVSAQVTQAADRPSHEYISPSENAPLVQSQHPTDPLALYAKSQDNLYYYIVGVSSYQESADAGATNQNVPFVLSSTQLMKQALEQAGVKPLPMHESYCVKKCATTQNVFHTLDSLPPTPGGNTVFIFYSGHGFLSGQNVQRDVKLPFADQSASPDTAITLHDILDHAKPFSNTPDPDEPPAYRLVVFLDSCHAGAAIKNGEQGDYLTRNIILVAANLDPDELSYQLTLVPEADAFAQNARTIIPPDEPAAVLPSAFGYYLARALTEDLPKAAKNEPALTLRRLLDYFDEKLKDNHLADGSIFMEHGMEVTSNTASAVRLLVNPAVATDRASIWRQLITVGSLKGSPPGNSSSGLIIRFDLGTSGSTELPLHYQGGDTWDEFALPMLVRDNIKTVVAKLLKRDPETDLTTTIDKVELKPDLAESFGANVDTLFPSGSDGVTTLLFKGIFPKVKLSVTLPIKLNEIPDILYTAKPTKGTQCSPSDPTCIPSS